MIIYKIMFKKNGLNHDLIEKIIYKLFKINKFLDIY